MRPRMQPALASLPDVKGPASDRLVLRDGTVAIVRAATGADAPALRRFFANLSAESRRSRFMGAGDAPAAVIDRLSDSSDPGRQMTLVAIRQLPGGPQPIGVASYTLTRPGAAETAFAVDDRF